MSTVIVGCGYIGLELGRQLRRTRDADPDPEDSNRVVGVRRSDSGLDAIREAGLTPVRADATDPESLTALPDAEVVVFAASSGGRGASAAEQIYVTGLTNVIEEYASRDDPPSRLVYTSSSGVYGDHDGGWVDESTPIAPTTAKTQVLAEAERTALEVTDNSGIDGTVVRFTGLYGPGRYRLDRYLDGPVTEGYLNMIHRVDAAGSIRFLLEKDYARNETVLAVDDEPANKWVFADWLADACGCDLPIKQTKTERLADSDLSEPARRRIQTSKRCSNEYLRSLGYKYVYPTYKQGYRTAIRTRRASDSTTGGSGTPLND